MDKSCSSSGEVFSVCVGKNECRLNFVDAGFANSEEEKTPLGPAWEDGQAWKNPRWVTERSAWHKHFIAGTWANFYLEMMSGFGQRVAWVYLKIWIIQSHRISPSCSGWMVTGVRDESSHWLPPPRKKCQGVSWVLQCVTQLSGEFAPLKICESLGFRVRFCAFLKCSRGPRPREGAVGLLYTGFFFSARRSILHIGRQNPAVVSPAKYAVNILEESNKKNVNALGKAPHCIVLSLSLNLVLRNQCMGPEQCKLFLNIQTANRENLLKRREGNKNTNLEVDGIATSIIPHLQGTPDWLAWEANVSKPSSVGRQPCCCCPKIFSSAFSWAGHAAGASHCIAGSYFARTLI